MHVITVPRQVGKTTIVQQLFRSTKWKGIYHLVESASQMNGAWIESIYNDAWLKQKSSSRPVILAIDEIQKIPSWSEIVKGIYDRHKFEGDNQITWLLLGSSEWLMQRGLSESLAGRFEQWDIPHWTFNELRDAFDVSPEVASQKQRLIECGFW